MPWKECHVMEERLRFVARLPAAKIERPYTATLIGSDRPEVSLRKRAPRA
jgi:hypothetical protein